MCNSTAQKKIEQSAHRSARYTPSVIHVASRVPTTKTPSPPTRSRFEAVAVGRTFIACLFVGTQLVMFPTIMRARAKEQTDDESHQPTNQPPFSFRQIVARASSHKAGPPSIPERASVFPIPRFAAVRAVQLTRSGNKDMTGCWAVSF